MQPRLRQCKRESHARDSSSAWRPQEGPHSVRPMTALSSPLFYRATVLRATWMHLDRFVFVVYSYLLWRQRLLIPPWSLVIYRLPW
jgi:hypothetical protein